MKVEKQEIERQIRLSAELIMRERLSWKAFTSWACEEFSCGMYKSNKLWGKAWEYIQKQTKDGIQYSKNAAFVELEELKDQALIAGDRRTYLDALKYQGKINKLEEPETQINIQADSIKLKWGNEE